MNTGTIHGSIIFTQVSKIVLRKSYLPRDFLVHDPGIFQLVFKCICSGFVIAVSNIPCVDILACGLISFCSHVQE